MDFFQVFKFFAFRIDPERAHNAALLAFSLFPKIILLFFGRHKKNPKYSLNVNGVSWAFPVGLAAGLDKNAQAVTFFSNLPFGAVEVGTVTPLPQKGNLRPRLFRYPKIKSLRNLMGFNNHGMEKIGRNIQLVNRTVPLGVNLGKNRQTPDDKAFLDYQKLYKHFASLADYLVINISSPNTLGLKKHQEGEKLKRILDALKKLRNDCPCPLFLKISPGLSKKLLKNIVDIAQNYHLSGIIATNTAVMEKYGSGGMSGEILKNQARDTRKQLLRLSKGTGLEIIGVGGISNFQDILEFWKDGGKVVQIYTAFVYQGPRFFKKIQREIDKLMKEKKAQTLEEMLHMIST